MIHTMNGQDWLDKNLYPFESRFVRLEAGNMHYIDEGSGETLLFVHGTPTWSFLYRDLIKDLSKDYRCIAIDHIGFGLSDKSTDFAGTPEAHAENLSTFIRKLDLKDITLVVHDFGGPIGLAAAIENTKRIRKVVAFNTWLWATKDDPMAQQIDALLNSEEGKAAYLDLNYSPTVLLQQAFFDTTKLSPEVHQQYIQAFPDRTSRTSLLKIGQSFVGSSDWYEGQWEKLGKLEKKQWMIIWGTKDPFLNTSFLEKFRSRLPEARIEALESGHFVQEEKTDEAIAHIRSFMK